MGVWSLFYTNCYTNLERKILGGTMLEVLANSSLDGRFFNGYSFSMPKRAIFSSICSGNLFLSGTRATKHQLAYNYHLSTEKVSRRYMIGHVDSWNVLSLL